MRDSRLDIRTSESAKARLEEAASILGTTTSAFVLEAAMKKAMNVLAETHTINLSLEGHKRLMQALEAPAMPNSKLKALVKKYG